MATSFKGSSIPDLGQPSPSPKRLSSKLTIPRIAALIILGGLAAHSFVTSSSSVPATADVAEVIFSRVNVQGGPTCAQPPAVPLKKGEETRSDFVWDKEFQEKQVERFLGESPLSCWASM